MQYVICKITWDTSERSIIVEIFRRCSWNKRNVSNDIEDFDIKVSKFDWHLPRSQVGEMLK